MENLNAEIVKKALECCVSRGGCQKCSYRERGSVTCMYELRNDALALINSQEQRIRELTEENERLREQNERYAELEEGCYVTGYKNIKADTVRQMQERLQAYFGTYVLGYKIPLSEALKAVNQIAKEMLEGL